MHAQIGRSPQILYLPAIACLLQFRCKARGPEAVQATLPQPFADGKKSVCILK